MSAAAAALAFSRRRLASVGDGGSTRGSFGGSLPPVARGDRGASARRDGLEAGAPRSFAMKHYYSPLECYLEIYGARQIVKHARKHAAHREDQIQAEADLVHYQNALKETTGIPGEVDSNLSRKEMHALVP